MIFKLLVFSPSFETVTKAFFFSGLDSTSSHMIILRCKNPYAQTVKGMQRIISHCLQWKLGHQIAPKVWRLFLCTLFISARLYPKAVLEIGKAAQNLGAHSGGGKHRHPREILKSQSRSTVPGPSACPSLWACSQASPLGPILLLADLVCSCRNTAPGRGFGKLPAAGLSCCSFPG